MSSSSRTYKSILNSSVALVMYFVNLVLQFYSRKVFLTYLGSEILGLNSTATNILQLFNLAELGISNAIAFTLYKPLITNDIESIRDIVELQGKIYRKIANLIVVLSILVMCFFPIIFSKMDLPLWYAFASFGVLLLSSLLGYYVNYKQIVLSADLKDYKIQYSYKLSNFIKLSLQIVIIQYTPNPYIWWLVIEAIFAVISACALNYVVYKTYPYLRHNSKQKFAILNAKFPEILQKTKQLFFHKISGVTLFQVSPLLIYAFFSLSTVTLYYNYMLVVMGIISLSVAAFNGIGYGVGNLIAEGNKSHILNVFYELYSVRFMIISTLCFGVFIGYQPFITLWIGSEYLLPVSTSAIFTLILYFYLSRYIIFDFIYGYGYFDDIWAAIAEVIINVTLSIILGYRFGLNGIISGVLIALILISTIWKPIYFFIIKQQVGIKIYLTEFIKLNAIGTTIFFIVYYIFQKIINLSVNSWIMFTYTTLLGCIIFSVILCLSLICLDKHFRKVVKRFYK